MIKFAGIQKTSLMDYPEHISTILFTQGCNLRCPYCHNPSLISEDIKDKENLINEDEILMFLNERKGKIDGVTITGGEPLMQDIDDLKLFLEKVKTMGLKVKIDTNGSYPKKLLYLASSGLIDYIAMDFKMPYERYGSLGGKINLDKIKRSLYNIYQAKEKYDVQYEIRTTVVPGMHESEDIREIAYQIINSDWYFIQNFKGDSTYNKELCGKNGFSEKKLKEFKSIAEEYIDNVRIRN
jgi:pyruvate formate lyase activating enzyme